MTTQQPINYTIEEVEGLLDPANKVSMGVFRACCKSSIELCWYPCLEQSGALALKLTAKSYLIIYGAGPQWLEHSD